MASSDGQEPALLHEKLKEQVTVSIKESLDKAMSVLSSLHRVQSYLEVTRSLPARSAQSSEGVKSALGQVQVIRNDAATLLQTIYLTEIGLQSLQEFDKQGSNSGGAVAIMPILSEAMNSTALGVTSQGGCVDLSTGDTSFTPSSSATAPSGTEAMLPPAKKMNLGVLIVTCSQCARKFATQHSSEGSSELCRSCRPATNQALKPIVPKPHTTSISPVFSSTPTRRSHSRGARKGTLPLLNCKICNTTFLYRRCMLRHLRENHTGIDLDNLHNYIEVSKGAVVPPDASDSMNSSQNSQTSSLNVTVGSAADRDVNIDTSTMDDTEGGMAPTSEEDASSQESIHLNSSSQDESLLAEVEGEMELGRGETDRKNCYVCNVCSKVFDRPYRLQRHIQIHDPNRPRVNCQICDRSFTRLDTLENHMKCLHSDERPYKCNIETCQKTFATQSALVHHLKIHMDGKPYQCLECEASFPLLNEYKQHMREIHADTEKLRCSDCYKVFPDGQHLEQHRILEHRLECEICGKTFARLAYLQTHVEIHNGEKLFNCKHCSSGFDTEYAYKQHIKTHPECHRAKRSYQCQVCDIAFQHPSNLVAHFRSQEHRDKANALGLSGSILNTIEGDFSDVGSLVDDVGIGREEDSIIRSIAQSEAFQSEPASSSSFVNPDQGSAAFTDPSAQTL